MQHSWITKALVQKLISYLPFKHRINFFFQKHITHGVELTDAYFADRLIHARNHLKYFSEKTGSSIPSKTLEMGTGWYPVIPIYLFLRGVNTIYSIDISNHIKRSYTKLTIKKFLDELENGRLLADSELFLPERIQQIKKVLNEKSSSELQLLQSLGIVIKIKDARKNAFSDEIFDLIHSNNTFEHIDPVELKQILIEFNRMLKRGGVMSHFIDMTDHFAHFDRSITVYNFLKFSTSKWKLIDNSIQPQNRLRVKDYEVLYKDLGFEYLITEARNGNLAELESVKLDANYIKYSHNDLAMSHCQFVSVKK